MDLLFFTIGNNHFTWVFFILNSCRYCHTIGLVSLPSMMTGQVFSGSLPLIAIKYQIMIMIAIFTGTLLSVYVGINFSLKVGFDRQNDFRSGILKKERN